MRSPWPPAQDWKEGLASWWLGPGRMRALKEAAHLTIFTPGSGAGVPLNVVGSLAAPHLSWDTEEETLRDEIEGFVSSLLGMAGIQADPIASREHVLMANLVEAAWRAGRDLDLESLIQQVQDPPLRKLGVFDVDSFFPPKDRTALAMRLNGLVAAPPSFAEWLQGPPLDSATLLEPVEGRTRASIVYLAHLSDQERQFAVTLLLSKIVTWLRGLSGTTDLRTLIYMDELFGFAPPTAAPPSKKPILTILKQARAFGVGMVLATQNPVDLDYKAMSNAGAWFIGRLQTERDKARILEGLQSAGGVVDVAALDPTISGLEQRRFLLHDSHQDKPQVFQTRWAMSYLRGPMTREQIRVLMKDAPEREATRIVPGAPSQASTAPQAAQGSAPERQALPPAAAAPATSAGAETVPSAPNVAAGTPVRHRPHRGLGSGVLPVDRAVRPPGRARPWISTTVTSDPILHREPRIRCRRPRSPTGRSTGRPPTTCASTCSGAGHCRFSATLPSRCTRASESGARTSRSDATRRLRQRPIARRPRFATAWRCARIGCRRPSRRPSGSSRRHRSKRKRAGNRSGWPARARSSRSCSAGGRTRGRSPGRVDRSGRWPILNEVSGIDEEWKGKASDIDELEVGLESTDVDVDEFALVWIPTA